MHDMAPNVDGDRITSAAHFSTGSAAPLSQRLVEAAARAVIDSAEKLNQLDRAIGDGDHGVNMKRGFEAVLAGLSTETPRPLRQVLSDAGLTLVMTVGGASGPLYGTLFMSMGHEIPERSDTATAVMALGKAIEAVSARGRSRAGQKTMLDTLRGVHEWLLRSGQQADLSSLPDVARQAARDTVPMQATCGRAAFLGPRSIGHMDPGAWSAAVITAAVCEVLIGVDNHA